jgi:hypothetical protein
MTTTKAIFCLPDSSRRRIWPATWQLRIAVPILKSRGSSTFLGLGIGCRVFGIWPGRLRHSVLAQPSSAGHRAYGVCRRHETLRHPLHVLRMRLVLALL